MKGVETMRPTEKSPPELLRLAQGFAKSMLRLGSALPAFGLRQASQWVDPRGGLERSIAEMDELSQAAEAQLGAMGESLYPTGRRLGERMVDTAFHFLRRGVGNSGAALGEAWRAIDRSWSASPESER